MRKARSARAYQVDVARDVELFYFHFFHPAVLDFPLYAHARDDGYSHAHLHEALDAFDGGHFDRHVQGGAISGEELDDATAIRRFDNMSDECLVTKILDGHF